MTSDYEYDPKRIVYFGATDARNKRIPFGIRAEDRMRHMYVIGKTGMGKSTLLENLAVQDIQNGEGMCFIDPHGSSAEKLLEFVPESRIDDVVYFAPFDTEFPIGFNVMEDVGYDKRHLVVAGLMSAFQRIWVDAWSARMEYILQNTLLALLEYPDTTLIDVNRMLVNKEFRAKVVEYVTDPIVKRFWAEEFAGYSDRYTQDATPAIQNKIGQFTSNPLVRNIVGQPHSSFDIRRLMDERKILIVNLSKGRMGEQNADLLGSILTTKIYLSAMSRAEETSAALGKLPPFYLYVDEFQSVVNDSFANILSEARKYKLSLTIAHQYIEQVEENIRAAVFGNVGTTIAFRVGPFDAETLKTVFEPTFFAEDLVNLGFTQMYLTLMIDGIGSKPFSATSLPPIEDPPGSFVPQIIESSRRRYAHPRAKIEDLIRGVDHKVPPGGFENLNKKRNEQRKRKKKAQNNNAGGNNSHNNSNNQGSQQQQKNRQERRPEKEKTPQQELRQHVPEKLPTGGKNDLREALAAIAQDVAEGQTRASKQNVSEKKAPEQKEQRKENSSQQQQQRRDQQSQPRQPQNQNQQKEVPKDVLEKMLRVDE